MLVPALPGSSGRQWTDLVDGRQVLTDFTDCDGRHLVLADRLGRHRLLVAKPEDEFDVACLLHADAWYDMRIAALVAFLRKRNCKSSASTQRPLHPSTALAHRLITMLRILDFISVAGGGAPSLREIASKVIYPWADFGRSIEWKSSSERRQTQRLVAQARFMMKTGYRDLLKGKLRRVPQGFRDKNT